MNIPERAAQLLSLEGKVAMVTGAASGIGRGIALALASMGSGVAVLDLDEQGGQHAHRGQGGACSVRLRTTFSLSPVQASPHAFQNSPRSSPRSIGGNV